MNKINTKVVILCALAIVFNIVLGTLSASLKLIYLDTIGTVFIAVFFGPWWGACVGALTNIITSMIIGPTDLPFMLVNIAVGIVVGIIAMKKKFTLPVAIITGLILSILCPLIGTPISIWVYGGLTGTGFDFLFLFLKQTGNSIFVSSFVAKILSNLIDKVGTCVLVYYLIKSLPRKIKLESLNKKIFS